MITRLFDARVKSLIKNILLVVAMTNPKYLILATVLSFKHRAYHTSMVSVGLTRSTYNQEESQAIFWTMKILLCNLLMNWSAAGYQIQKKNLLGKLCPKFKSTNTLSLA